MSQSKEILGKLIDSFSPLIFFQHKTSPLSFATLFINRSHERPVPPLILKRKCFATEKKFLWDESERFGDFGGHVSPYISPHALKKSRVFLKIIVSFENGEFSSFSTRWGNLAWYKCKTNETGPPKIKRVPFIFHA